MTPLRKISLILGLFVFGLASCGPQATPVATITVAPSPTAMPSPSATPSPEPFIILAYATDGIVASIIPYDKLTHINYAFLTPNADGTFNPITNGWKLQQIAQTGHQHNVKVSISVGGWGWDAQFETMAADPKSRAAFVQNLKAFVDQYQLDGMDIDWEYPDAGESSQNFLALIQELRTAMPDKLLTTAVVSYGDDNGGGVPSETFELFDFVNIMTYDGPDHGSMQQFEQGMEYWQARGLPKDKIVMGLPFYGDPDLPYFKIVQADPAAAQNDTFELYGKVYHYNGIPTVRHKTEIALEQARGIMFWALDHDTQGDLSLVNAIYQAAHP